MADLSLLRAMLLFRFHLNSARLPLSVVAVALLAGEVRAQSVDGPNSISLQQAVVSSLKQDPALRVQAEAIEQKSGLFEQASGQFDWIGLATGEVSRQRTPVLGIPTLTPTGLVLLDPNPVDSTTSTGYTVGVDREFRNGITITPQLSVDVVNSYYPASPAVGVSTASFVISVPLLRGLGNDSTGAAEAAARGDIQVARLLYQHALAEQAYTVAASYWSSRAADEALVVQQDVERGAERLVQSTKVLVDSRVFAPAFLIQAEANLRDKRSSRIAAELTAKISRFDLGQALGLPPQKIGSTPAALDDFPTLVPPIAPADDSVRAPFITQAIAARPDMLASRASLVPLNLLERQAEIDLKPQANLTAGAGYSGINEGNSLVSPINHRATGVNGQVGLNIAWPFHNSYQRGLLRERRGSVRAAQAQADDLERQVAADVLTALESVRLRADGVRSAKETVDLAKRALTAQYESLKAGNSTILDVITLENLSADARISYVSAYAAYATAIAQLHFALGSTFAQSNPTAESFYLNDLTALPRF